MTTSFGRLTIVLAAATLGVACAGENEQGTSTGDTAEAAGAATPAGAPGTGGMAGHDMRGMSGGMMSGRMMRDMTAHMRAMHGAAPDSLHAVLPMHRQMTADMLAEMNREMWAMNMAGDAAWTATVDSLRDDLVRMPEMSGEELRALLPAHAARVERLMAAHQSMMAAMK